MGGEGQTEIVPEFECKTKNTTTNRVKNLINSSVHIRIAKIMEANKINKVMDIVSILQKWDVFSMKTFSWRKVKGPYTK